MQNHPAGARVNAVPPRLIPWARYHGPRSRDSDRLSGRPTQFFISSVINSEVDRTIEPSSPPPPLVLGTGLTRGKEITRVLRFA